MNCVGGLRRERRESLAKLEVGRGESNYISFKNSMNDISVRKKLSSLSSKTFSQKRYSKSKLSNKKVSGQIFTANKSSPLTNLRSKNISYQPIERQANAGITGIGGNPLLFK